MLIIYFIHRNGTLGTQSFYFTSMVGMKINLRFWGSPPPPPNQSSSYLVQGKLNTQTFDQGEMSYVP